MFETCIYIIIKLTACVYTQSIIHTYVCGTSVYSVCSPLHTDCLSLDGSRTCSDMSTYCCLQLLGEMEELAGPPGPPGSPCAVIQTKGLSYNYPAEGCEEIARNNPQSTNRWYWVCDSSDNSTKRVYCYPSGHTSCGEGFWMRIGYFDMGSNLAECPEPLEHFAVNGS